MGTCVSLMSPILGQNFALSANKAEWSHVSQVQSEIGAGGQPRREKNTAVGRRKKRKKDIQGIPTFKCGQLSTDRSYELMSFWARKLDDSIFFACFKLHVLHLVPNGAHALSFILIFPRKILVTHFLVAVQFVLRYYQKFNGHHHKCTTSGNKKSPESLGSQKWPL